MQQNARDLEAEVTAEREADHTTHREAPRDQRVLAMIAGDCIRQAIVDGLSANPEAYTVIGVRSPKEALETLLRTAIDSLVVMYDDDSHIVGQLEAGNGFFQVIRLGFHGDAGMSSIPVNLRITADPNYMTDPPAAKLRQQGWMPALVSLLDLNPYQHAPTH